MFKKPPCKIYTPTIRIETPRLYSSRGSSRRTKIDLSANPIQILEQIRDSSDVLSSVIELITIELKNVSFFQNSETLYADFVTSERRRKDVIEQSIDSAKSKVEELERELSIEKESLNSLQDEMKKYAYLESMLEFSDSDPIKQPVPPPTVSNTDIVAENRHLYVEIKQMAASIEKERKLHLQIHSSIAGKKHPL